jgi:hypothetical protein
MNRQLVSKETMQINKRVVTRKREIFLADAIAQDEYTYTFFLKYTCPQEVHGHEALPVAFLHSAPV